MNFLQSLFLGFVQGITEFLPVSSSGHLVVFQHVFGLNDVPLLFDIILHGATLGAVIVFFKKEIVLLLKACFSPASWKTSDDMHMVLCILLGTVPTGIIAVAGKRFFEQAFHSVSFTGFMFFVTAGLLLSVSLRKKSAEMYTHIPCLSAFFIGCIQGCAVLPGISRSGATIVLALLLGIKRDIAFKFSFLLSIPAIAGALVLESKDYFQQSDAALPGIWFAGAGIAFIAGIGSLYILNKVVMQKKLSYFAYYCIIIGIIVFIVQL